MDLTDAQWTLIAPFVDSGARRKGRGRPWQDARAVVNGVFWVLRTGAAWADLPRRYPPHQTCHRRYRTWLVDGTLSELLRLLALDIEQRSTGAGPGPAAPAPTARRSWKWHTSALLQSPVAVEALGARRKRG
jgi:transposase